MEEKNDPEKNGILKKISGYNFSFPINLGRSDFLKFPEEKILLKKTTNIANIAKLIFKFSC